MPIQYPTEIELPGPWLLDETALLKLDEIIDEEWVKLERRRNELITKMADENITELKERGVLEEKYFDERRTYYINNPSYELADQYRNIVLYLANNNTYQTERFSSALRDNSLLSEIVTGFSLDLKSANVRVRMTTEGWSKKLRIDVSPEDLSESREIYVSLRNWAEQYGPNIQQKVWEKLLDFSFISWVIWLTIIFIGLSIWNNSITNQSLQAKDRAVELLNSGIDQQNMAEAIKLILIINTNYDPISKPIPSTLPQWIKITFWVGLIVNLLLLVKVKTILGVGKGKKRITFWRVWYKLTTYSIPALVFVSIIWPKFIEWVTNLIK